MAQRIVSPNGKTIILAPVHPNQGIEADYRRRLDRLITEMHKSLLHFLRIAYRANEPELLASDDSPAAALSATLRKLIRRWTKNFSVRSKPLAEYFATAVEARTKSALQAALKKAGFTVKFKWTAATNDCYQAVLNENVGLIKSIAAEHLSDVEGMVMRSVSRGRDLASLTQQLEERYQLTRKRASFIARDQNNKATSVINSVKQRELGIETAIWMHSGGGRVPRPSHVKAGRDRLVYRVSEGALIDGKRIWPGELPNCRCVARAVIPGLS